MLASPSRSHAVVATAALVLAFAALALLNAAPASAARSYTQSGGFYCSGNLVRVSPPRIYADWGRTEQAFWSVQLERWNGTQWAAYTTSSHYGSFNYYGTNVTSWSVHPTSRGGWYNNNYLNVPVSHAGAYRVISALAAAGVSSAIYVAGGAYCTIS
jgi:hypothetical protein